MGLEWESDFETGNEDVDLQHRYFLDLINRIRKSFSESNDIAYKEKLIIELRKYADFHFTSEENIATFCNLSGVSGHHQRHLELLEEFKHQSVYHSGHTAKQYIVGEGVLGTIRAQRNNRHQQ